MGQNAGYFNKANQRYSFLFLFYSVLKKLRQKIDKRVVLSFMYFNKCLEIDFVLTPSKIPTCTSQANLLKIGSFWILPQRKT